MYCVEMNAVPWKAFPLYEQGNRNHERANNGSLDSIISLMSKLDFVKPSSLGSIPDRSIT
jgi:hypothetical protein